MRLIDADALETHEQLEPFGNGNYEYVEVVYKDDIDDAPTIDAVPREKYDQLKENAEILSMACDEKEYVTRCKDCVYQIMRWNGVKCCEAHGDHIGADYDFCSNGRRKNDEID